MLFANSAIVLSKLSLAMDCSNSGGAEDKRREGLKKKCQPKRKRQWLVRVELDHTQCKRLWRGRIVGFPLGKQGKWVTVLSHHICTRLLG